MKPPNHAQRTEIIRVNTTSDMSKNAVPGKTPMNCTLYTLNHHETFL